MPVLGLILVTSPGCTIIEVQGAEVTRSSHFGIVRVEPAPGADLVLVRTRGVGIVPSRSGVTVGVLSETLALAYDGSRCQVILFENPQDDEAAQRLRGILQDVPHICVARGEGQ